MASIIGYISQPPEPTMGERIMKTRAETAALNIEIEKARLQEFPPCIRKPETSQRVTRVAKEQ